MFSKSLEEDKTIPNETHGLQKMPEELIGSIFGFFSVEDVSQISQVSKLFRQTSIETNAMYRNILEGLKVDVSECKEHEYIRKNIHGLAGLGEKLFTPAEIQYFPIWLLQVLLKENGLTVLREKILTLQQLTSIHPKYLEPILSDYGVIALREKLITLEQVIGFCFVDSLEFIFSQNGIKALRERIITIENAQKLHYDLLYDLVREKEPDWDELREYYSKLSTYTSDIPRGTILTKLG